LFPEKQERDNHGERGGISLHPPFQHRFDHKCISSLSDTSSHDAEMERLEKEREEQILALKQKHEAEAAELEAQRKAEEEALLTQRKAEEED